MSPDPNPSETAAESDRIDAESDATDDYDGLDRPTERHGHATPDFEAARKHVLTELVRFVGRLRQEGASVPASGALEGARALAVVGFDDRDHVADALRASLLTGSGDRDAFEAEFPTFWHRLRTGIDRISTHDDSPSPDGTETDAADSPAAQLSGSDPLSDAELPSPDSEDGPETADSDVRLATGRKHATGERPDADGDDDARLYSAVGRREPVAAADVTLAETEAGAVDRFVDALSTIAGRRSRLAVAGDRIDARRALRASLGTGGTAMDLPTREAVPSELRCCLLLDVSGSVLDTIDRETLLAVAERVQNAARRGSVFLFDTDLVEATEQFDRADGDPARALRDAEIQWGGGTQIGGAFDTLRRDYPHAVDRRTVVVIVSDGLDVGDQDTLEDGITWLAGRADAIIWLNPLAVSPAYEPRSRGMATALPYVDGLFGFAAPTDLAEAARQLERYGVDGPVGYEHDPRRVRAEDGPDSQRSDGGGRE
ncbi:VWA domain-containing protein [Natronorubrum sp. JWXQ-INN-674]|uniref:VWA domain-containing protein n=1 Tax=Natronorubrum halalkaliphilum TaxID=2691917 RepID=A0A6B0VSQ4_9EURY|nr:VWA domain-containing protein [Natronorubrum halalkaliphilum]MXV64163.1 VWA domain-containing protein [Natronorubrum halalkaliphilum]